MNREKLGKMTHKNNRQAFSLVELAAVTVLLGVLVMVVIPRVFGSNDAAKIAACYVNKGDIEIQSELWMHNKGSWPASNLSDIRVDLNYFPEDLPTCPVNGTAYSIDPLTGLVVGHNH